MMLCSLLTAHRSISISEEISSGVINYENLFRHNNVPTRGDADADKFKADNDSAQILNTKYGHVNISRPRLT